jgi:hypothetical protein
VGANLFKTGCKSCIGPIAQDELDCLGIDYTFTDCTTENVATCGQDFSALLELYPVFDLSQPLNGNGLLFEYRDRVLFIEDDGYSVSLREANSEIQTFLQAVQPQYWTHICKLKLEIKYENRTLFDLVNGYKPYEPRFFAQTWADFGKTWALSNYIWSNPSYKKQLFYKAGDKFRTLGPCEETLCVYLVTKDIEVTDDRIKTHATFVSDPEHWTKIICIETGFNSCLGYQRKNHPADLYEVVSIGSDCHKVEVPIDYVPSKPLLNELTYIKIKPFVAPVIVDGCACPAITGSTSLGSTLSIPNVICNRGNATIKSVVWLRNGVPIQPCNQPPYGCSVSVNPYCVTNFTDAWSGCNQLYSFPLLNVKFGITFTNAWKNCSNINSFPALLDVSNGTAFDNAWSGCSSLLNFPMLNTSNGVNFEGTWSQCLNIRDFPQLNVGNGISFRYTWSNCASLTDFPILDFGSGLDFRFAWNNCLSLATFPPELFDSCTATQFNNAWSNCALNQTSVDNILVSLDVAGQSGGTVDINGGSSSAPGPSGIAARDNLISKGWTVNTN